MATVVTTLLALLKLDDKQFKSGMKDAKKDAKDFGKNIKSAGNNIRDFGNNMTVATAPIALGLGVAINDARTFDKSMANINAILGVTGSEASDLREEILAYGGASRQGPQAVADAYYDIVSGVQDASTHMAILDAATRTADAGQADLKATTSALIGVMNAYGFAAEDAGLVSDVFTNTVRMGKLSMDELASSMPNVTGLAAEYGVSINDLGSALSFMTTTGTTASESATFLKSMITTLLNPTTELETAINALGYESGQAMLESEGLVGSYEALKAYNNGTFSGLITNTEALQGATKLTNDAYGDFNDTFQETVTGSTDAAKAIQDQGAGWDLLGSAMSEVSVRVVSELTPILLDLINTAILPAIDGVLAWMQENPELTQQLILMAGAAVILGPAISLVGTAVSVVTGIVGLATTAWGLLSGGYAAATAAQAAMQAGTAGLGTTMLATVGPIVAIGAAIAGVIVQMGAFSNAVNEAQRYSQANLAEGIGSGDINIQDVQDAAFSATAGQFGGGVVGDVIARLTYSNTANAAVGDQAIQGRAVGGGVPAGSTLFNVNEDGRESWRADGGGEIIPLTDGRNGGGDTYHLNIYADSEEGGRAAARGFEAEFMQLQRMGG